MHHFQSDRGMNGSLWNWNRGCHKGPSGLTETGPFSMDAVDNVTKVRGTVSLKISWTVCSD